MQKHNLDTSQGNTLNHQREIFGWGMYDWANSAFSTIVVTALLGPYLTALVEAQGGTVGLLGFQLRGATFIHIVWAFR